MDVAVSIDKNKATIKPNDRLTVQTAPELEEAISQLGDEITDYEIDLEQAEYVSSAGLRVLVNAQKLATRKGGTMTLKNVASDVKDVFDMTGLSDVFVIVD